MDARHPPTHEPAALPMLIAQVSDLHVCAPGQLANGVVDTNAMARAGLRAVAALQPRPDALLLSGDLVEAGGAAS